MTMESAQLTPNYYRMICSNGLVTSKGETLMFTLDDEPKGVCSSCPYIADCGEPVPLPCQLNQ